MKPGLNSDIPDKETNTDSRRFRGQNQAVSRTAVEGEASPPAARRCIAGAGFGGGSARCCCSVPQSPAGGGPGPPGGAFSQPVEITRDPKVFTVIFGERKSGTPRPPLMHVRDFNSNYSK
jgi:hypothetical protein